MWRVTRTEEAVLVLPGEGWDPEAIQGTGVTFWLKCQCGGEAVKFCGDSGQSTLGSSRNRGWMAPRMGDQPWRHCRER